MIDPCTQIVGMKLVSQSCQPAELHEVIVWKMDEYMQHRMNLDQSWLSDLSYSRLPRHASGIEDELICRFKSVEWCKEREIGQDPTERDWFH